MARIICYRGVARDNPQFEEALTLKGRSIPRGGPATPAEHNLGDTASTYVSWTTDRTVAVEKALDSALGGRGVVLAQSFDENELIASPDFFGEYEVLIRGEVVGASVTWVP